MLLSVAEDTYVDIQKQRSFRQRMDGWGTIGPSSHVETQLPKRW